MGPGPGLPIDDFVGDLLALVATLDRPPVLVGASLGGIAALVASGEHPGLARGLVLVDVVVSVERAGVDRIREFLTAHHDGFASLEDVAAAIEAYNPVRRRSRNLDGLRKNVRQHDDGRWYWHWDPEFISNDDEPQRRTDRQRLRRAASAITIPTLIVWGLQSDVVSDAGITDMQQLIPRRRSSKCSRPATWSPAMTTTFSPRGSPSFSRASTPRNDRSGARRGIRGSRSIPMLLPSAMATLPFPTRLL